MASEEIGQHVAVRVHDENVRQNTSNVQAKEKSNVQAKDKSNVQAKDKSNNFFKNHSSVVIWLLSVMAVAFDPFFFYIPVVKNASTCLGFDNNLRIVIVVLRSFVDVLHTILWWPLLKKRYEEAKKDKEARKSRNLLAKKGKKEERKSRNLLAIKDKIEERKSRNHLILAWTVAILAILPLPQVVVFAVSWRLLTVKLLRFIVLIQFFIRLYRIIPAYKDARRSFDMLPTYTWIAAAFNLIMYTIASNVFGAYWYLRAVERNMDCWKGACHKNQTLCVGSSLYCDHTSRYNGFLNKHCSIHQASNTKSFDYGIYNEAFQTIIIETDIHFLDKFFQCFWWGLRNMSSLGQNLKTGTYLSDTFFAVVIATCGLVLFAIFIGNMQTYLQTKTPAKLARMKHKKSHLHGWNPFNVLPGNLKQEVTFCEDPIWEETTEVNLESLLNNTPTKLRKKLKSCLCEDMHKKAFTNIPELANLRQQPQDMLLSLAKPLVFPEGSYILREGDPIYRFVFVVKGHLLSYSKHSTQTRVPVKHLSDGCFFGEELLQQLKQVAQLQHQAQDNSSLELPIASETIQAITKVEAFALSTEDLHYKLLARYPTCLYKWQLTKIWAVLTIQAAWRNRSKASERKNHAMREGAFN